MIGPTYWSTGITVAYQAPYERGGDLPPHAPAWSGRLDFYDDGFADDSLTDGRISTEGTLHTRYAVEPGEDALSAVIDTLIRDATRLGIGFSGVVTPSLYCRTDLPGYEPPVGWQDMLVRQSERIGWRFVDDGLRVTPAQ